MTEQEWLACTDCDAMLRFLQGSFGQRLLARLHMRTEQISLRRLRLYYCACARDNPVLADNQDLVEAVDAAERYADGVTDEVTTANERLAAIPRSLEGFLAWRACDTTPRFSGLLFLATDTLGAVMSYVMHNHAGREETDFPPDFIRHLMQARKESPTLLRDIFGNPFHPCAIDGAWLACNNAAALQLARGIYADRRFADLPILADALEEAGCRDERFLAHCREPGPHVLGCWVVDALLGKK